MQDSIDAFCCIPCQAYMSGVVLFKLELSEQLQYNNCKQSQRKNNNQAELVEQLKKKPLQAIEIFLLNVSASRPEFLFFAVPAKAQFKQFIFFAEEEINQNK